MDVLTALLTAIAERLGTVPGVKRAEYPAINAIQLADSPAAIVFPGSPNADSVIERNTGGGQLWTPAVMAQLLVPREGNTQREFSRVDALIVPVVDAFNGPMHLTVDGAPQHIDRVLVSGYRAAVNVEYAGHIYYAAEFYFAVKFR